MKMLVIAAHPDDEVLGCGATMARYSREGHQISVAILGEGITSRYAERDQAGEDELNKLRACSERAAHLIGVHELLTYSFPDNRFDTVPLLDLVKTVEELVGRVKPATVFCHHGGDLNIDHTLVFRAVMTALRTIPGQSVKKLYTYEVPSSTEWSFQKMTPVFTPNTFFEVGETLETKLAAMQIYEGEAREFPHPRSAQALRAIAERWGSVAGVAAAEAFELIREVC
ncbi:MAG: PIG-L family deacetylase [Proteobacteria bacterium]|nr:PIG-L family deacetylase [Pseudomonadota bacterium]MBU1687944.1 PIG-L family deacetylase [Pseudomonadota bacterium]